MHETELSVSAGYGASWPKYVPAETRTSDTEVDPRRSVYAPSLQGDEGSCRMHALTLQRQVDRFKRSKGFTSMRHLHFAAWSLTMNDHS